jgi:Mechanosensitive ion channel, beta-domain
VNEKDQSNERVNVFAVGDRIRVNLHTGRIVEATIKAVINRTGGPRFQVDFGKDETALIYLWQVVEKASLR